MDLFRKTTRRSLFASRDGNTVNLNNTSFQETGKRLYALSCVDVVLGQTITSSWREKSCRSQKRLILNVHQIRYTGQRSLLFRTSRRQIERPKLSSKSTATQLDTPGFLNTTTPPIRSYSLPFTDEYRERALTQVQ